MNKRKTEKSPQTRSNHPSKSTPITSTCKDIQTGNNNRFLSDLCSIQKQLADQIHDEIESAMKSNDLVEKLRVFAAVEEFKKLTRVNDINNNNNSNNNNNDNPDINKKRNLEASNKDTQKKKSKIQNTIHDTIASKTIKDVKPKYTFVDDKTEDPFIDSEDDVELKPSSKPATVYTESDSEYVVPKQLTNPKRQSCDSHYTGKTKCDPKKCHMNRTNACINHSSLDLLCDSVCPDNLLSVKQSNLPIVNSPLGILDEDDEW